MVDGLQGSFCECAQPVKDGVALEPGLSLAGRILKIIPGPGEGGSQGFSSYDIDIVDTE